MEKKLIETILENQEKSLKILSRISEQLYDQEFNVDKHLAYVKNRIFLVQTSSPLDNIEICPAILINVIPSSTNLSEFNFDINNINNLYDYASTWNSLKSNITTSSEGIVKYVKNSENKIIEYVQLLRTNIIEAYITLLKNENSNNYYIDTSDFKYKLLMKIKNMIKCLEAQNIEGPYEVYINFINCKGITVDRKNESKSFINSLSVPKFIVNHSKSIFENEEFVAIINNIYLSFGKRFSS